MRFRPIMMTTMAALVGTLPIALGWGAGAESRRPLGVAVVGGLAFSQLVTLYVTPVIYTYFDELQERFQRGGVREHREVPSRTAATRGGLSSTGRSGSGTIDPTSAQPPPAFTCPIADAAASYAGDAAARLMLSKICPASQPGETTWTAG